MRHRYERALAWLFETPAWQLFPERHVFTHVLSHALREALRTDLRIQRAALAKRAAAATPGRGLMGRIRRLLSHLNVFRHRHGRHVTAKGGGGSDTTRPVPDSEDAHAPLRSSSTRRRMAQGAAGGAEQARGVPLNPPLRPLGIYPRMGLGILVTAEDRRYDWLEAGACGHVVHAPYYSPSFFLADHHRLNVGAAARGGVGRPGQQPSSGNGSSSSPSIPALFGGKSIFVVESGPTTTSCHRFDNRATPERWACYGAELRNAPVVRRAARAAMADVAQAAGAKSVAKQTQRSTQTYADLNSILRAKAAMYASSTFCLVLAGDSAITTRIFSIVQSLCIPGAQSPRPSPKPRACAARNDSPQP